MIFKTEDTTILKLSELLDHCSCIQDPEALIQGFIQKLSSLINTQYYGLLIFPNKELDIPVSISNNPFDFEQPYLEHLMKDDFLLNGFLE